MREPVRTFADLMTLDPDEISAGYREYERGDPEPGPNRSRAYWHGWRNAHLDDGGMQKDEAQAQLARECAPGGVMRRELFERRHPSPSDVEGV